MKKKILLTIFLILIICITSTTYAATRNINKEELHVVTDVNVEDPLFTGTENVENNNTGDDFFDRVREELFDVEEAVYDDIYLMEEKVTINQKINGNLYVIAEEINIESASINGNIFLIAEKINIEDTYVSGSAYMIAEEFNNNSYISDLYFLGSEINLLSKSSILRNARIIAENANIDGNITYNCYLDSDNINISKDGRIGGTLSYYSSKSANIENNNIGNIEFNEQKVEKPGVKEDVSIMNKITDFVGYAFKAAVVAGAWILLSKKVIKANKELTVSGFFKALGIGILVFCVVPVISICLIISILGIGLGLVVLAIYAILLYMSLVVACLALASRIVKTSSKWKVLGVTVLIYLAIQIITMISGIGILIGMLMGLAGLGFIIKNIVYKEKEETVIKEI